MSEPKNSRLELLARRDDDPVFTIGTAAAFFDLTVPAFRKKEELGYLVEKDGSPIIIRRTVGGERRYSLNDLLKISHALRRQNKMTDRQLRLIVLRIDAFKEPIKHRRKRYRKGNV
jgi:uncharacterized Ntn-hydrolase superfamily protein